MTKPAAKDNSFLNSLERAVADILENEKTKTADRLKAIEAGAKLLTIRHRIEGMGTGDDGTNFFGTQNG
jgi:hypothetical protein